MNDKLATIPVAAIDQVALESVIGYGDLTKLNSQQRTAYYAKVCESLGLNPLTRPFEFINLNGKLVFYARRDCTDQLRKIHSVSITIVSRERLDDVYVVTARASFPDGRVDESIGAVPVGNAKGETLANALMKAETKAKRRVTLAICGLSVLDESELDGAREGVRQDTAPVERQLPERGAISPHGDDNGDGDPELAASLLHRLEQAMLPEGVTFEIKLDKNIETPLKPCATYDEALAMRAFLGTKAKQSEWAKAYQAARENMNTLQSKLLGKVWNHCDRQVAKLEKALVPDVGAPGRFDDEPSPEDDGR